MGWLRKILGLEKEKPKDEVIVVDGKEGNGMSVNTLPNAQKEVRRAIPDLCALCSQSIGTDRWKKVGPNYMHKKCFKKKQKDMLNGR
jgi:hypothetical protein